MITILAYVFLGILALFLLSGAAAVLLLWHGARLDEQDYTDGSKRFDLDAEGCPMVIAGSDLYWSDKQEIAIVNARFAAQVAPYVADERAYEAHVVGCYVLPEPSPEVQR